MFENPEDELVSEFKAVEDGCADAQFRQSSGGGESMLSAGPRNEVLGFDVHSASGEGGGEDRIEGVAGQEGDRNIRTVLTQARCAQ